MRYLLLALLINGGVSGFSQDLIVTTDGDSINCVITREKKDFVYFTFSHQGEVRSTLLPLTQVSEQTRDYFEHAEVPASQVQSPAQYPRLRFAFHGGYSRRLAKISDQVPPDFRDYMRALKSGYHLGADAVYFVEEAIGIGVKYSVFRASHSLDNIYVEDEPGRIRYGQLSDDIAIHYVGPTCSFRIIDEPTHHTFTSNLSMGYMHYANQQVVVDPYRIKGSTLGLVVDLGYDFSVSQHTLLGFRLSLVSGVLSQYQVDNGTSRQTVKPEVEAREGLGRIDLSVGLCFR